MTSSPDLRLDREQHIKYWQRCRKSYLPSAYTAADSTRLMWAGFIFSAYDVLSIPIDAKDRSQIRAWVLALQHPDGGFCGSPTHAHEGQDASKGTANLAATFFALVLLALASGDGMEAKNAFRGVKRRKLLRWLRALQREDGSFGQNLWEGSPVGGSDTRHSYLASSVRWMIRGDVKEGDLAWEDDVDIGAMVHHIRRGQTYDGCLIDDNQHESHAGYSYCSVAALLLADRPWSPSEKPLSQEAIDGGVADRASLLKFLAGRQFAYQAAEEDEDSEDEDNYIEAKLESLSLEQGCRHVGFNGRWNKKADTCYVWWAAGTLAMLEAPFIVNVAPARKYLLEITQHRIGGFGKVGGAPPDIYHAYLGLAALATMGDEDLKDFDAGLCCSKGTTEKIAAARDGLLEETRRGGQNQWTNDGFWS